MNVLFCDCADLYLVVNLADNRITTIRDKMELGCEFEMVISTSSCEL